MRINALVPLVALTLVAGCAAPFEARVARFQALPAPPGQTFTIQARDPAKAGGLEFATYAGLVTQRLIATGYTPAPDPRSATLVVNFDYQVGRPRERIESTPGYGGFGYGGFGPYGYGGFGRGGFGYGGFGYGGFGYGGFGGFGYGGFGGGYGGFGYPQVYSVTQYDSYVDMKINRAADNVNVFEGRAETVATTNDLTVLVPNLVTALFTNFPGNSGQTVTIKVPPLVKARG